MYGIGVEVGGTIFWKMMAVGVGHHPFVPIGLQLLGLLL